MKQKTDAESTLYEERLQREIERIKAQINELQIEQRVLENQLVKARRNSADLVNVSRKNSATRLLIERRTIEYLSNSDKPVSTHNLFKNALYANYQLKENTFRTYLHRMKLRGLIESGGKRGTWRLNPS